MKRKIVIILLFVFGFLMIAAPLYLNEKLLLKIIGYNDKEISIIYDKLNQNQIKKLTKISYVVDLEKAIVSNEYQEKYFDEYIKRLKNGQNIKTIELELNEHTNNLRKEKYYIEYNLEEYLSYLKNNNTSYEDTIAIVNANKNFKNETNAIIVNKNNPILNVDFNLIKVNKKYSQRITYIEENTYKAFLMMANDALKDGVYIKIDNAYISYDTQADKYSSYINDTKISNNITKIEKEGYSEHQLGIALDLYVSKNEGTYDSINDYEWLKNNSYKYGFILRYPIGKENITGYFHQEEHYTYVGKEISQYIYENHITYDEYYAYYIDYKKISNNNNDNDNEYDTITITTAGDCTLGTGANFVYKGNFDWWFKEKANSDYNYFFKNVKKYFENDDFSYVNMEGTLTTSNKKEKKKFNFKGDPSYANILLAGDVEGVNLANNHTNDYGEEGYNDTKKYLNNAKIDYFGYDNILIKNIKGIKIAFLGYTGVGLWISDDNEMAKAIKRLKKEEMIDIVVVNFHWGNEYSYTMTSTQIKRAHLAINSGADIVIGSHPHVVQGIEKYNDKYIIYSLGNFVFGGNSNPGVKARTALITKLYITVKNKKLDELDFQLIPVSISSIKNRNNYQPTPLIGKEKESLIKTVNKYSVNYQYIDNTPSY